MRRFPLQPAPPGSGGWKQAITMPTPTGPYLAAVGRATGACDTVAIGIHNLPDGADVTWSISIALGVGRFEVMNEGGIATRDTVLLLGVKTGAPVSVDATVWASVGGKTIGSARIRRQFACDTGGGSGS